MRAFSRGASPFTDRSDLAVMHKVRCDWRFRTAAGQLSMIEGFAHGGLT